MMPSFRHLHEVELDDLVAYLHTHANSTPVKGGGDGRELTDPIPPRIESSGIVVPLDLVTQVPASSKDKPPLTRITKLSYIPDTPRTFIVDLRGNLYEIKNEKSILYFDIAKSKPRFINQPGLATGFGSFAFHPEFLKNGLLYTTHTESPGSAKADFNYADSIPVTVQWVLSEWKTEQPASPTFVGTTRELLRIDMVTGMHGVQEITFNPNAKAGDSDYGLLYIGIGDGACVESGFPFLCHNVEQPWGTIFRIDPAGTNSANGKYGIPVDNPFVKASNKNALDEIYAYGFRNPFRITWSSAGLMLASNIGQAHIESVNLIMPGHDYGWPIREGTFLLDPLGDITKVYPLPPDDQTYRVTYPVAQYDHDEGLAIAGGFEYTGSSIKELKGKFLFADMNNGRLYYMDLAEVKHGSQSQIREWGVSFKGLTTTFADLCGSKRVDLRIGQDSKGDLYFFSKQDGKVYRLGARQNI
jgi:glucose/arabinose dehydrogenase